MAWYDKYYNKKTPTGNFFYVEEDEMLYPEYAMVTRPKNAHNVRWYYYYKDDNGKLIRVTEKMRSFRKILWMSEKSAEEFMPECFL